MEKIDVNKIVELGDFVEKLSKGIEPLTNTQFSENNLMGNDRYRKVFFETAKMLKYLINLSEKNMVEKKISADINTNLSLIPSEIDKVIISEEPISVSEIAYNVNNVADKESMKKIKATQITTWLHYRGYLKVDESGKTSHKVCTEKAKEIGISSHIKENSAGQKYLVNLYDVNAQQFIIDNINSIAFF